MDDIVFEALVLATKMHDGQKRKYGKGPYIIHPICVAREVWIYTRTSDLITAALLHDTVEDTGLTLEEISHLFGDRIASLVDELTDKSTQEMGNRAVRKEFEKNRLAKVSDDAKTIKIADIIDNTFDIVECDPEFANVYLPEQEALLEVLKGGNGGLRGFARMLVMKEKEKLNKLAGQH